MVATYLCTKWSYLNTMKKLTHSLIFVFAFLGVCAQNQMFQLASLPEVLHKNGEMMKNPWTGGLHTPVCQSMDVNLDGEPDLVVFDKAGDRILCFVFENGSWIFNESYSHSFPEIRDWMQLVDYNGDGKKDIFSYTTGGIRVWRNISGDQLEFELASNLLYSKYYAGEVNLFALPSDFPAILDIDGDGDLDILNFWTLGVYIDFHRNMSMEIFGNADSLVFVQEEHCWGKFTESEENNLLTLFDPECFKSGKAAQIPAHDRHSGSSMFVRDLNEDGAPDLLLGDLDFPGIIRLMNVPEGEDALMQEQFTGFPSEAEAVNLLSCPTALMLDVDKDGIDELLAAPSDEAWYKNENTDHFWLYENSGKNNDPVFSLAQKDFLIGEMIQNGSSSYPVFFDWDGDGLKDMFVSNYGIMDSAWYEFGYLYNRHSSAIQYYKNTASGYQLIAKDFGNISSFHKTALYPAFMDVDNDGDADLLCGSKEGEILFFENTVGQENPDFVLKNNDFQQLDCGTFSTPQLFDFNQDGLEDLLVGNRDGYIRYFQNTGDASKPVFELKDEKLGNVQTVTATTPYYGHSIPSFFRNASGEILLIAGSASGQLFFYNGIKPDFNTDFQLFSDNLLPSLKAERTAPAFMGNPARDLLFAIGNLSGGLFVRAFENSLAVEGEQLSPVRVSPNPADDYFWLHSPEKKINRMELMSLDGRKIRIFETDSYDVRCSIGELRSGLYLLNLWLEGKSGQLQQHHQKILIQ